MQQKKELRESNIEVLRIICMLLIVAAHFVYHGGALSGTTGTNQILSSFIVIGGKVGFDCFIVISAWFLVNSKFKLERFIKIWGQVLFYNVVFLVLTYLVKYLAGGGSDIGIREALAAFFPIAGSSHGYASVYLIWYLMLPILQIIQKNCSYKQLVYIVWICGIGVVGAHAVTALTGYNQNSSLYSNDLLLFVFIYFLMVFFHNKKIQWSNIRWIAVLGLAGSWMIMGAAMVLQRHIPGNKLVAILSAFVLNEKSVLNIVAALGLFSLFMSIDIPFHKSINFLAASTFGVLLYHDHNYFRDIVWNIMIVPSRWFGSHPIVFLTAIIMCTLCIYIIGVLIDTLRRAILENKIMHSRYMERIIGELSQLLDFI